MSEELLIKMRSMRGCPVKAAAHLGITPSAITNWKAVPKRFEKKLRAFLDTYKAPKPKSKVYIKWRDDERVILCDMKAAGASNADIALVLKREEISIAQQISFLFRRHGPDWARMLSATTECDLDEPSCPNEAWPEAKIDKEERRLRSLPLASFRDIIALDAQISLTRHSAGRHA